MLNSQNQDNSFMFLYLSLTLSSMYQAKSSYNIINNKNSNLLNTTLKTSSTLLLAIYSLMKEPNYEDNSLFNYSLLLHSLGDLIIELPNNKAIYCSMAAFCLGHVLNTCHLSKTADLESDPVSSSFAISSISIAGFKITSYLSKNAKAPAKYIIPFYACALKGILISASLQEEYSQFFVLAASAYILSDLMLGYHNFVKPLHNIMLHFTWPLYYFGQVAMIALVNDSLVRPTGFEPVTTSFGM